MSADELVYTRTVSGPKPFVFACLTEPGHLSAFLGPAGTTTPLDGIIVEPRPGGRFETLIVNSADSSTHHMRAVFDEVDAPHTLSWTESDSGMSTTMTFTDAGADRTEIRIHQRGVPEAMRGPDEQNGFQSSLDRFERYPGLRARRSAGPVRARCCDAIPASPHWAADAHRIRRCFEKVGIGYRAHMSLKYPWVAAAHVRSFGAPPVINIRADARR